MLLSEKLNETKTISAIDEMKDYKFETIRERLSNSMEENQLEDVCDTNDTLECSFKSIRSFNNPDLFLNVYPIVRQEDSLTTLNILDTMKQTKSKYTRHGENSNYIISIKLDEVFFDDKFFGNFLNSKLNLKDYLNKPILFLEYRNNENVFCDSPNSCELELTNGFKYKENNIPTFNKLLSKKDGETYDKNNIDPNWFSFNYNENYKDAGAYFKFIKISNKNDYIKNGNITEGLIENKDNINWIKPFYLIFSTKHNGQCLKLYKKNSQIKLSFGICNGLEIERFYCYESKIVIDC